MANEPVILTREALYERVWAEPITHVAASYGLSGRGLGKLCARHQIPVPPRGWWAKKQHGHKLKQPALLPVDRAALKNVVFHAVAESVAARQREAEADELQRESKPDWQIHVPEDLEIAHPLVKRAASALRQASRARQRASDSVPFTERYQVHFVKPGPGEIDIAVSRPMVPRALRIMQALLSAFDRRGYAVTVNEKNETIVSVLDESFQISLMERLTQIKVSKPYGMTTDCEPSGCLRLQASFRWSNSSVGDAPPHRVETALNKFIKALVRGALYAKQQRAAQEDREHRWRTHDDERRHREQANRTERLRRHHLRKLAARWTQQERLRGFIDTVTQRLRDRPDEPANATAAQWIAWATGHLQRHDAVSTFIDEPWPVAPMREPAAMPWHWK